jgi:hypothetical protein
MAQHGYIFGGDTGISYEQLQRRRKIADALAKQSTSRVPQNVGEGLNAIGQALMARHMDKKLASQESSAPERDRCNRGYVGRRDSARQRPGWRGPDT